ncbi:response regulator [uncultured Desulfosarcina sp.]|uniref:ATP-binding response regulator n=1 Tax=uncultured Desulfosarcina sp. TaxID=218289 RepID=UPI0029C91FED|nr:response regulator [uncultured Desulfosarcina sp.]
MEKNQRTLLCIDDEPNILNALKRLLRKEDFRLLTANSGKQGLQILAENEVHVVVSDQRMPEMSGTEFLKEVKAAYPDIIRIILTGYTDVDSISEAINEGHLYKFFLKPWNDQNLKLEIRQALEQYDLMEDNKRLHDQVFQKNEELKKVNESLEQIILERTQNLEFQNKALQISHAILDDIPLPILGVSSEMLVVMANKAARQNMGHSRQLEVGDSIGDCFDATVESDLLGCLGSLEKKRISARCRDGRGFEMDLIPLTGRYQGQGIIMTLNPATD